MNGHIGRCELHKSHFAFLLLVRDFAPHFYDIGICVGAVAIHHLEWIYLVARQYAHLFSFVGGFASHVYHGEVERYAAVGVLHLKCRLIKQICVERRICRTVECQSRLPHLCDFVTVDACAIIGYLQRFSFIGTQQHRCVMCGYKHILGKCKRAYAPHGKCQHSSKQCFFDHLIYSFIRFM